MHTSVPPNHLPANYFDGSSARAVPVLLHISAGTLHLRGLDESNGTSFTRSIPLRAIEWPERTRHGIRIAHFQGGGSVQCANTQAWDEWSRASGQQDSLIVKAQQNWHSVMTAIGCLLLLAAAMLQWGIPLAASAAVALIPPSVDASMGESALQAIDEHLMEPSRLKASEQEGLRNAFAQRLSSLPASEIPPWKLEFRKSNIGPNALALPGGVMILTDELVTLVDSNPDVIAAVLAHELGHIKHRHSVRLLVQTTILGALSSAVLGDFSTLLAAIPAVLGQANYSREAEREADAHAVTVLRAAGISPAVMIKLFDQLNKKVPEHRSDDGSWLGIAFASHPADQERIRFFENAAKIPLVQH